MGRIVSTDTRMDEPRQFLSHSGRDISPTLLRKIARDIGVTVEELLQRGDDGQHADEADGFGPPLNGRGLDHPNGSAP